MSAKLANQFLTKVKKDPAVIPYVALGFSCYVLAAVSTFNLSEIARSRIEFSVALLSSIFGLIAIVVGYGSIILLGGAGSLKLAGFIAHATRTKQMIEPKERSPELLRYKLLQRAHQLYVPVLLFILSTGLAWDIYNADAPRAGIFRPVLHALDIFSRPPAPRFSAVLYSLELLPALVVLTAIGGLVISITIPYFGRFKITGINAGPFHTTLLFTVTGLVAGLGVILTLVGLIYQVLWVNRGTPVTYHYALLMLLGLSFHYSLGIHLGSDRAVRMIEDSMAKANSNSKTRSICLS